MSTFINLRGYGEHTNGSLTDVGEAIGQALEYGQKALAITDARTLAGVPGFVRRAKAAGIKPIIGMEVSLATSGDRLHVHRPTADSPLFHNLTLLARNTKGWENLVAINNASQDPAHIRPVIDVALLARHSEGLILLTGGMDGPLAEPLTRGLYRMAAHTFSDLVSAVGAGSIFVEMTNQGVKDEGLVADGLRRIAALFKVPVVATSPFSYVDESLAGPHAAITAGSEGPWQEPEKLPALHLRSEAQMREANPLDPFWQDAVGMTAVVADSIDADVLPSPALPQMPRHRLPNGHRDAIACLRDLAVAGLNERDGCTTPMGMWRLEDELKLISDAGAAKYFLLLRDLTAHLRSRGITLGAGRGTAGSSYVLYGLGVTDIDPLETGLHFEAFLKPGQGLPVFDLDLEPRGREVAFKYLTGRYGKGNIARVSAYIHYRSKRALSTSERILGRRTGEAVPSEAETAALADALEGRMVSVTSHPSALVISADPIAARLPLRTERSYESSDVPALQWAREDIEGTGLLVINLMGLHSLTPMGAALKAAAGAPRAGGQTGPVPHPSRRDLASVRKAWRLLYEQDLPGLKLGSRDLKKMLDSGKVTDLSELANLYAVARFGTGVRNVYLASSAGTYRGTATALNILARVTSTSRGVLLYQEQIADLAVMAAGYTVAEGLRLWQVLAKDDPELTAIERDRFTAAVTAHLPREARRPGEAEALFAVIAAAAPGARSRAHSRGMALQAFNRAWLMHSFPEEYAAAS